MRVLEDVQTTLPQAVPFKPFFTLGGFTMDFEGYCVKCRTKRQIKGGKVEVNDKGRRMVKGTCPVCGTNVTRFLPKEDK